MVFVSSELSYDSAEIAVPFVVGPSMIKGQQTPVGMVFSDTRVAGIHPYRGGRLIVTVILYSVVRNEASSDEVTFQPASTSA